MGKNNETKTEVSHKQSSSTGSADDARSIIVKTMASPGAKFILIGVITCALLIPALMVWALVEERSRRAVEVVSGPASLYR